MSQIESVLYASPLVAVGTFRCPTEDARFGGGAVDDQLVVFPRTAVVIERTWHPPVLADPTMAVFYDKGDEYRRTPVDRDGDHCDWFSVAEHIAEEMDTGADGGHTLGPRRLFPHPAGMVSPPLYLLQRRLLASIHAGAPAPLIDEAVIDLVGRVVGARAEPARSAGETTRQLHRSIVDEAKQLILGDPSRNLSLQTLAEHVHVSPFHLARVFRTMTNLTVHQYLTQVRLRRALDLALDPATDLSTLAVESGFSSHSHFTYAFRRSFGFPPARLRRMPADDLSELRKIVTV